MNWLIPHEDYSSAPVPAEARVAWWRIMAVWAGFIIVVGVMAIGGAMAPGMTFREVLLAVLLGNLILGALAALSGYVAAGSGLSFAQLIEAAFPGVSARIVALYTPLTLICWYAIECAIFGNLIADIFLLEETGRRLAMAAAALFFATSSYIGFRAIQWVSVTFIPIVILLAIYALSATVAGGTQGFAFAPAPMPFETGLGLVIGSWALGVVAAYPDIARFARSRKAGVMVGFFGIVFFNSLCLLIGAVGAAVAQQADPAMILLAAGTPALAFIFAIGNIWTTNDANLYSASLGAARTFNINRRTALLLCAALGLAVALANPSRIQFLFPFVLFLGMTAPALGGVVLGGIFGASRTGVPHKAPCPPGSDGSLVPRQATGYRARSRCRWGSSLVLWCGSSLQDRLNAPPPPLTLNARAV
ncbi:cytosine permease [Sphingosinicella sp.]|uniref:cytosine permease n=1 Tax=Sphingosinicella sp. TaxID=1917971 RepID=UPI0040382646